MPRNRPAQDREEKRAEIVAAAVELFTQTGYDETSMTAIARRAGVTTTTIYWYVADKDALLVAALDHVLAQALADYSHRADDPWDEQLLWAVDQLEHHRRLMTVVHARAATSPSIDAWHTGFHELMDGLVTEGLRGGGVPDDELAPLARIVTFVIEGLLTHPHTAVERQQVVEVLTRWGDHGASEPGDR